MTERLVPAKNGACTVFKDQHAVHSRYDPVLEAERYIASLALDTREYRCFILVEPGLGYMVPVLRRQFPSPKILILHCSPFFARREHAVRAALREENAAVWNPESPLALEDFLEENLSGADASSARVIEWRPAAAAYGAAFLDILGRTVQFLRRENAGMATVRAFGRRWLKNVLRGLDTLERRVLPRRSRLPLAVCAAGPSLEQDLPELAAWKASSSPPLVMAVSSAVPCLVSAGIIPGIIISTDGGNWAQLHVIEALRLTALSGGGPVPLFALALNAAAPSITGRYAVLSLADGSFWQRYLLSALGIPFLAFPQRGTVGASALDLAFFISSGPVYVSGLDFRHNDLAAHCRPYAFDRLAEETASRLEPAYSRTFERAGPLPGAFTVYDAWFRKELPKYPKRLFALSENRLGIPVQKPAVLRRDNSRHRQQKPELPGLPGLIELPGLFDEHDEHDERGKCGEYGKKPLPRKNDGIACLLEGLRDPLVRERLAPELAELLFPGREVRPGETADLESELWSLRE